jgi:GNAT superfamily N-acetyltransferase
MPAEPEAEIRPEVPAFSLRLARLVDAPVLKALIAASVRGLSRDDYTDAQIEAALGSAFGVDTELIRDGTYFVAESAGEIVGCGGWSKRRTLFGGDQQVGRQSELLDPLCDAARIRAFFVRPDRAREGIGRALLADCEDAALAHAFVATELMATLPGYRLYRALGYVGDERIQHSLPGGAVIEFIPMRKNLL